MRRLLVIYTYIFLFISSGNSELISATNESVKNNQNQLNENYLYKLPTTDYIIGVGDKLNISVSRDIPELMTVVTVDGEGTIYLPKLNRVFVKNLTQTELNNLLNEAYAKFVRYPNVEVLVTEYRPIRVQVRGEVENPGLHTLEGAFSVLPAEKIKDGPVLKGNKNSLEYSYKGLSYFFPTLFDAIRASGGITEYSDLSNIKIIRKNNLSNGGGKITTEINYESMMKNGDNSPNIRVYDSDIIIVKKREKPNSMILGQASLYNLNPKFINVFVTGRVNVPGTYEIPQASVLTDAIALAGGSKVVKGPLTFIRFNSDGTYDKRKFRYRNSTKRGSYKNPKLKNGDLIFIGESFATATTQIIGELTSPLRGIVSTYALLKVLED